MRTTLTKERNRVRLRILSKAAHELAFLAGLPAHTDLIVRIQRISIVIVITFRMSNYGSTHSVSQYRLIFAKLTLKKAVK